MLKDLFKYFIKVIKTMQTKYLTNADYLFELSVWFSLQDCNINTHI
jgi:hypothetical protein